MLLLIDNHDSFTHNLAALFEAQGALVDVVQAHNLQDADIKRLKDGNHPYHGIIISPGPKSPAEAHVPLKMLEQCYNKLPILGICLGHQILVHFFGGTVCQLRQPFHGVVTPVKHNQTGLFAHIPQDISVTRYHSLAAAKPLPDCLRTNATDHEGCILGVEHKILPLYGVQFHPEACLSEAGAQMAQNFLDICNQNQVQDVGAWPRITVKGSSAKQDCAALEQALGPSLVSALKEPCIVHTLDTYCPLINLAHTHAQSADNANWCFLDSAQERESDYFSILGIDPLLCLEVDAGKTIINSRFIDMNFKTALNGVMSLLPHQHDARLPLINACLGYIGYDYAKYSEMDENTLPTTDTMPTAHMSLYNKIIIENKREKCLYLISRGPKDLVDQEVQKLKKQISTAQRPKVLNVAHSSKLPVYSDLNKETYMQAFNTLQDYLARGHCYVLNLTSRLCVKSETDPWDVYCHLRQHNPAPQAGYIHLSQGSLICASPERFLKGDGRDIYTIPIKGTRKRSSCPIEDELLANELANSAKDKEELLMIVDLERNDLNRFCIPESVEVKHLFHVEQHPHVHQLTAQVKGRLKAETKSLDVLFGLIPGGSITGAPKRKAVEIIEELEESNRGLYTGCLGYLGSDGSCDFNIIIRSATYTDKRYSIGAGGGITHKSQPDLEYEELHLKAQAIIKAISDVDAALRHK